MEEQNEARELAKERAELAIRNAHKHKDEQSEVLE